MLANERKISASTHNQALSALLFLYREVVDIDLPWLDNVHRPSSPKRIPSVLTKEAITQVLLLMEGVTGLIARLLYGTGMRLMEGLRLRVKDIAFDQHVIIVRQAKGNKDRVVMLPHLVVSDLRRQMMRSRAMWEADRQAQRPGVEVPDALALKHPKLGQTWGWCWMFSSPTWSRDPRNGIERWHHLYEQRL